VQDFEHLIRDFFDGLGFLPDDVFNEGTRNQPLGEPKAGLSPELDALAAYVTSLDRVNPSPHRNPDGSLTADGAAGKAVFERLGCDFCHGGAEFTNSGNGSMPDVGTLTELSGMSAGETLFGIDTPTLLGVWETPPYLHDGSAPTLRDVITTNNPDGLHGYVSVLSSEEVDQLVAYVMQIDGDLPPRRLPFEPATEPGVGGGSGQGGSGQGGSAATGNGGASASLGGATGSAVASGGAGSAGDSPTENAGCGCKIPPAQGQRGEGFGLLVAGLLWGSARRRRKRSFAPAGDASR
jgi:MYXO-CTERM domain-containing protein